MSTFRFTTTDGVDKEVGDIESIRRALRSGEITRDTSVLDSAVGKSLRASALLAFHQQNRDATGQQGSAQLSSSVTAPSVTSPISVRAAASPKTLPRSAMEPEDAVQDSARRKIATSLCLTSLVCWPLLALVAADTQRLVALAALLVVFLVLFALIWMFGKKSLVAGLRAGWIAMPLLFIAALNVGDRFGLEKSPKPDPTSVPNSKSSQQKASDLVAFAGSLKDGHEKAVLSFVDERRGLGMKEALSPGQLSNPRGLAKSRATVQGLTDTLVRLVEQETALLERLNTKLAEEKSGSPARGAQAVGPAIAEVKSASVEWQDNQRELVARLDAIMNFIAARQGSVSMEGGNLVFYTQPDLDRYRALLQALDGLSVSEKKLGAQRAAAWDELWRSLGLSVNPAISAESVRK